MTSVSPPSGASLQENQRAAAITVEDTPGWARGAMLRQETEQASQAIAGERERLAAVRAQVDDLHALDQQLRAQQARIIRALIAEEVLVDVDFVVCPRCGQDLAAERGQNDTCVLCLQPEPRHRHADSLESERKRLEEQIEETTSVLQGRFKEREARELRLQETIAARDGLSRELQRLTVTFISDHQLTIEAAAGERATVLAEIRKYEAFLTILEKSQASEVHINRLMLRRDQIRDVLKELTARPLSVRLI